MVIDALTRNKHVESTLEDLRGRIQSVRSNQYAEFEPLGVARQVTVGVTVTHDGLVTVPAAQQSLCRTAGHTVRHVPCPNTTALPSAKVQRSTPKAKRPTGTGRLVRFSPYPKLIVTVT